MYELPILPVRDHQYYRSEKVWRKYELPILLVRDRYYRWMVEGGVVWCEYELAVLPVRERYYRRSLTGTTGRVCSESNSQILNRFVSRLVFGKFGRGKLED
jgi:hypothetical protein